jgi:hypothetical protein
MNPWILVRRNGKGGVAWGVGKVGEEDIDSQIRPEIRITDRLSQRNVDVHSDLSQPIIRHEKLLLSAVSAGLGRAGGENLFLLRIEEVYAATFTSI